MFSVSSRLRRRGVSLLSLPLRLNLEETEKLLHNLICVWVNNGCTWTTDDIKNSLLMNLLHVCI